MAYKCEKKKKKNGVMMCRITQMRFVYCGLIGFHLILGCHTHIFTRLFCYRCFSAALPSGLFLFPMPAGSVTPVVPGSAALFRGPCYSPFYHLSVTLPAILHCLLLTLCSLPHSWFQRIASPGLPYYLYLVLPGYIGWYAVVYVPSLVVTFDPLRAAFHIGTVLEFPLLQFSSPGLDSTVNTRCYRCRCAVVPRATALRFADFSACGFPFIAFYRFYSSVPSRNRLTITLPLPVPF